MGEDTYQYSVNMKATVDRRKVDQILSGEIFFDAIHTLRLGLIINFTWNKKFMIQKSLRFNFKYWTSTRNIWRHAAFDNCSTGSDVNI